MRKTILAAGVCAALAVGSAPVPAFAQLVDEVNGNEGAPEDPRNFPRYEPRPMPYTEGQVETLAAGMVAEDVLRKSSRAEVLRIYGDAKADLRARLAAGEGFVEFYPSEDGKLAVPDLVYTARNSKPTEALSAEEVAYFRNAEVWKEHLILRAGQALERPVLEEPKGLALDPSLCTIQFTPEQIPALAAGLHTDEILYHSGSRADALKNWEKAQAELQALVKNGQARIADPDLEGPNAYGTAEYTASSVIAQDAERSSKGLTVFADSPFSPSEAAYFMNSAVFTAKMAGDCGRELYRTPPTAPGSLKLALAPDAIAGIVLAIVAVLGLGGAAFARMIPGVRF